MALALVFSAGVHAAELEATVRDAEGRPVPDAVVVAAPAERPSLEGRVKGGHTDEIEQIDLEFVPKVKAIRVGTALSFPNRDNVRHHVYSFSPAKRFELPLYMGTPGHPVVFDTPGVVVIGCNIHDWMVAHIYVAESPYFAVTDGEGRARIAGIPAGRYTVRTWHARLVGGEEATRRTVALREPQVAALDWRVELKPPFRVRRAPAARTNGRY